MELTNCKPQLQRIILSVTFGLLGISLNNALANDQHQCIDLEQSNLTDKQLNGWGYQFSLSHNQQYLALYQHFESEALATFKLWDSNTGKLLKTQKTENYVEKSNQVGLSFSPNDQLVYLMGMTEGVPFWNLQQNRLIFSPCDTAMGISNLQFSNDGTVAYVTTVDSFHSLCHTDKKKRLAGISYAGGRPFIFDKAEKHLYAGFASTNTSFHQGMIEELTPDGLDDVSIYQSPILDHPHQPESNDSFATLLLDKPPNHRLLVAKSLNESLELSLWDYRNQKKPPNSLYQREFKLPELVSKKKPVADGYGKMLLSADEKQAAFLSRSGLLVVFDIASGEIHWKTQLPAVHTKEGWENYSFDTKLVQAAKDHEQSPSIVIKQNEPEALLFFNWKTGGKRSLPIPEQYTLVLYQQFGQYLWLDAAAAMPDGRSLILNWKTAEQQPIEFSSRFFLQPWLIPGTSLLLFASEDYPKKPKPYAVALFDLKTKKYQILEMPFQDDGNYFSKHLRPGDEHHLLIETSHHTQQDKAIKTLRLYNLENQQYKTLVDKAHLLHFWPSKKHDKASARLPKLIYDDQQKQTLFCWLNLQ